MANLDYTSITQYTQYLGKYVVFFYKPMPLEPFYSDFWIKVSGEVKSVLLDEQSCEFVVNDEFYAFSEVMFV
ncbi:hypothetical protein [Moraxella oblonga]|uniref:hypothetical protein n=1 Tax=Moraxella oblonga TaxID=200413 RepID=UPI00082E219B|nr:hypothetical protein [Moraxella oblonga]